MGQQAEIMPDLVTLADAKAYLRKNYMVGVDCPCCTQHVQFYRRPITSAMAYALYLLFIKNYDAKDKYEWVHVEEYLKGIQCPSSIRGDFAKLKYWGLIEQQPGKREDESVRNGYYRITPLGQQFTLGVITVPSHVYLFKNKVYAKSEKMVSFRTCLKKRFNYDALMKGML